MDAIETVCGSLPASAERIRRRFWRDPEFRTVCEDYRDALQMLARLDPRQPANVLRIEEYQQVAAELLAEARAMLDVEEA